MAQAGSSVNLLSLRGLVKNPEVALALAFIVVLVIMTFPIPAFALDIFLVLSIALSVSMLLVSLYTEKPIEFNSFPTILLLTTLFRLALNVASTRRILLHGHEGPSAVGHVIEAFGNFVVGGNYVVGLIVFSILAIINFVVITKGSGRVSEVAARFILDAMPGKQMSIDADLNAGMINESEARKRRKQIEAEADFYGAMDGASKFVRGDAIAAIIITLVNIIGGLVIGVFQHDLNAGDAARVYTLLTVGDGLLAQIPALIVSTASGILVTRTNQEASLSANMLKQIFGNPKALGLTGAVLLGLSILGGLPRLPFFLIGSVFMTSAYMIYKRQEKEKDEAAKAALSPLIKEEEKIENLLSMDLLELEVGYGLISIVDSAQDGDLLERVQVIRKQFATELGIIIPSIHIRDNLQLEPGKYRVLVKGVVVASGDLLPDHLLAMNPGHVDEEIDGKITKEPVFGLDAVWITKSRREEASLAGYTVVDLSTIIATHLTEAVRKHSHELLGRQELQFLLDTMAQKSPKVVEDLAPSVLPPGSILTVLKNLLREQVSVRDLKTILETLALTAPSSKDIEVLTEQVRSALHRSITKKLINDANELYVAVLEREIEETLVNSLRNSETGVRLAPDPHFIQRVMESLSISMGTFDNYQASPVLLVSPVIRPHFKKLLDRFIPGITVLSHNEIGPEVQLKTIIQISLNDAQQANPNNGLEHAS